jgi:hypothetical protein
MSAVRTMGAEATRARTGPEQVLAVLQTDADRRGLMIG